MKREELYKDYVTEILRRMAMWMGYKIETKYSDLIAVKNEKVETRSSEEIIDGIKDKLGKLGAGV